MASRHRTAMLVGATVMVALAILFSAYLSGRLDTAEQTKAHHNTDTEAPPFIEDIVTTSITPEHRVLGGAVTPGERDDPGELKQPLAAPVNEKPHGQETTPEGVNE